ncbi:bifunctional peptidase and [Caerostris extrusa]|uniref:Bifunctional peptidase and n=1 Tax=Caerostris extrusa TaxID=172846 RepID=A0AAV4TJJ1_CAEEX|nr:bifunctional peptidase and [Caerostris extrusa]
MDDRKQKLNPIMDHLEDFTKEYCAMKELWYGDSCYLLKIVFVPYYSRISSKSCISKCTICIKKWCRSLACNKKWKNNQYLRVQMQEKMCTVAVTPNGYADAIVDDKFVLPEERTMPFSEFLDEMESPRESRVFYLQKQNNCLADEFSSLLNDVDTHISWATDAIGDLPEAANFWLGDKRAVTSLHKDNYENIYCVIQTFQKSEYYFEDDEFKIKDLNAKVKWIPFDPEFPDFRNIQCFYKLEVTKFF